MIAANNPRVFQIKVLLRPVRTAPMAINQPLFSGATSGAPVFSCSLERTWLGREGSPSKHILEHQGQARHWLLSPAAEL